MTIRITKHLVVHADGVEEFKSLDAETLSAMMDGLLGKDMPEVTYDELPDGSLLIPPVASSS